QCRAARMDARSGPTGMTTIRERCLAAFAAALGTVPGISVERNRTARVRRFPSAIVLDGGQSPNTASTQATFYTLPVSVEAWITAAVDAGLGPCVSAIYGKILAAALADPTLGGVAVVVREGEMSDPEIDREEGIGPTAAFAIGFEIDFLTAEGDASALP